MGPAFEDETYWAGSSTSTSLRHEFLYPTGSSALRTPAREPVQALGDHLGVDALGGSIGVAWCVTEAVEPDVARPERRGTGTSPRA